MMKRYSKASRDEQQAFLEYGDRVIDGDTTPPPSDLESTYMRVQRAMRSNADVSRDMPDHLKMRAWEDIMETAAAPAMRPPIGRRKPVHRTSTPLFRMGWTGMANAALAVLVVIAGFGAWRVFVGDVDGGGNSPAPSEGRYAQAPMTPVPMATAETVEGACDFSTSIPLYQNIDTVPSDATALYITSDGRAMLHCEGQAEDTLLASDVTYAQPSYGVPNVVQLHVGTGDEATLIYLNVATNDQMQVDMKGATSYLGHMNQSQRFHIGPAPNDPFSWGVYDIETMTSVSLNELTGATFTTNGHMSVSIPEGGVAMAFAMGSYRTEGSANIVGDKGGTGDIVVVNKTLDEAIWVTIPDDFPLVTRISISNDGSKLALVSNPYSPMEAESVNGSMISIVDVASGEEIARTAPFTAPNGAFFTWVEDGAAVIYASDSAVYRLPAEADATPSILYESDTALRYIDAVMGPNIVLVQEEITPGGRESRVIMLTTNTGEVAPFEGNPWSPGTTSFIPFHYQLAPIVLEAQGQGTGSWSIVDPRTGKTILSTDSDLSTESVVENEDSTIRLQQARIVAADAPVSAVLPGDGRIVIVDLSDEEAAVTEVAMPADIEADGYRVGAVSLAPDGSAIIVETTYGEAARYWTLDLSDDDADWVQLPAGAAVSYLHSAD